MSHIVDYLCAVVKRLPPQVYFKTVKSTGMLQEPAKTDHTGVTMRERLKYTCLVHVYSTLCALSSKRFLISKKSKSSTSIMDVDMSHQKHSPAPLDFQSGAVLASSV